MSLTPESLCKFLPIPLFELLQHAKNLKFEEAPDYDACRGFLHSYMKEEGMVHDYQFDWSSAARALADGKTVESVQSLGALNSSRGVNISESTDEDDKLDDIPM